MEFKKNGQKILCDEFTNELVKVITEIEMEDKKNLVIILNLPRVLENLLKNFTENMMMKQPKKWKRWRLNGEL